MKLTPTARQLYDEIAQLEIIDAHTHIPAEAEYLAFGYSGPNLFAGGYVQHDLESAGMPKEYVERLRDTGDQSVEKWWPHIKPLWENIRHTSYCRALRVTARDWFGIDDINDQTIHELAAKVKADNTLGLYSRVFKKCGTRVAITCVERVAFPADPQLRGLTMAPQKYLTAKLSAPAIEKWSSGTRIENLEDAEERLLAELRHDLCGGAIGIKLLVGEYKAAHQSLAESEFSAAIHSKTPVPVPHVRSFLADKVFNVAAEMNIPVAVHTGYWGDYRELDPKFFLDFALRRRDVRFDLFHLGMPMVQDALMIGKRLPNVTLNLTWCPIISQEQTRRALSEIIDLVPLNKITMFGNDYRVAVQKAWGHLVLARECAAAALGDRVDAGDFDKPEALRMAKMWFHDNPYRIYGLERSGV
ncbi:MAG TPA: amidohydrolase family protein [Planctomycetota bacterium]|jgi:predicted TIM-barrel fold metal-dependent hydrolase